MRTPTAAVATIVALLFAGCTSPNPATLPQTGEPAEPLNPDGVVIDRDELPESTPDTQSPPVPTTGSWDVDERTDPITDVVNVFSTLSSQSGDALLVVRCMDNVTGVMLIWDDYLGSDDGSNVTHRFDDQDPQTLLWPMTTSSTAHLRTSGNAISFVRQILEAQRLVVRTTPFRESPVTAIYNLAGARNALAPVRTACAW